MEEIPDPKREVPANGGEERGVARALPSAATTVEAAAREENTAVSSGDGAVEEFAFLDFPGVSHAIPTDAWSLGKALWLAAYHGNHGSLGSLAGRGGDVDHVGEGETALLRACRTGDAEVVSSLLELKADLEREYIGGFTPWITAVRRFAGQNDPRFPPPGAERASEPVREEPGQSGGRIIRALAAAGALRTARDTAGLSGWHHACSRCAAPCIRLLCELGVPDLNEPVGWHGEATAPDTTQDDEPLDFKYGDTGVMLACLRLCTTNTIRTNEVALTPTPPHCNALLTPSELRGYANSNGRAFNAIFTPF